MSGVRWLVRDERVCEMLCEMNEMSAVWDGGERWAMWNECTLNKLPKPHDRATSTQHFRSSYWRSYQLPRTTFTYSKLQKLHGRATSTKKFRGFYGIARPNESKRPRPHLLARGINDSCMAYTDLFADTCCSVGGFADIHQPRQASMPCVKNAQIDIRGPKFCWPLANECAAFWPWFFFHQGAP